MSVLQCAHVGNRRCDNEAPLAQMYCSTHRFLTPMRTPTGSWAVEGKGALSLQSRLHRDSCTAVPPTSVRCDGFPYLTRADVASYALWRSGQGPKPEPREVLDRFPVMIYETMGRNVRGTEDAIFSSRGQLFPLDPAYSRPVIVMPGASGSVRYFRVNDTGQLTLAVRDDWPYQVVTLDTVALDAFVGAK